MPYIVAETRAKLKTREYTPVSAGELNYVISMKVLDYLNGRRGYAVYNEVIGVLECVKQEMYRRAVAPYEDLKVKENGDLPW